MESQYCGDLENNRSSGDICHLDELSNRSKFIWAALALWIKKILQIAWTTSCFLISERMYWYQKPIVVQELRSKFRKHNFVATVKFELRWKWYYVEVHRVCEVAYDGASLDGTKAWFSCKTNLCLLESHLIWTINGSCSGHHTFLSEFSKKMHDFKTISFSSEISAIYEEVAWVFHFFLRVFVRCCQFVRSYSQNKLNDYHIYWRRMPIKYGSWAA